MLTAIKSDDRLKPFLKNVCEEKGGSRDTLIEVEQSVKDHITVVKVEEYYDSITHPKHIKKIDCLSVSSKNKRTNLYLIEIKEPRVNFKRIRSKDIVKKFEDTVNDFMTDKFGDIFLNKKFIVSDFKTYYVSSLFENKKLKEIQNESLLLNKTLEFRGIFSMIEKKHPSDFKNIIA